MSQAITQTGFNQDTFEAFLAARNEPDWLTDQRREAWRVFEGKSWPARNEEEWIRTDIRLFKLDKHHLPLSLEPEDAEPPKSVLREDVQVGGYSVALNGRPRDWEIEQKWREKGVIFGSLDDHLRDHGDLLRPYLFQRTIDPGYDKFSALHAACWSGGHLLYVPRGVVVEEPFHALSAMTEGGVDLGHTLVILEEGAEATFLTEMAGESETHSGFHCGGLEIIQAPGSNLRFVQLQDWGDHVWHFAHQKAVVDRDASIQWTIAALGGRLAKVNQEVGLTGKGANAQVNGVLFTEGKQHIAYHTLQHHEAANTRSDFLYKAALQDKSRTVWRGMIKVDPVAQKTDGYQRNDNLLLTNNARADSIPGLEIEADDVRCTHGSTTGKVDEELVFYCMCRGLTRREAVRAIVSGFFQQISDRITIPSVRDALAHAIGRKVREYD